MRILVLYQAKNCKLDQPGYYEGFERLTKEGWIESHFGIGFNGVGASEWADFWAKAESSARDMSADAIFLQFFHAAMPDPTDGILRLRNLPTRPLIFSSLGDPFGRWTNRVTRTYQIASGLSEVNFLTGMGYLSRQLMRGGAKNLVLMPHGVCQVRFANPIAVFDRQAEFDAVFIGNRMAARNRLGHFFWASRRREAFVNAMTKRYGRRFGLFGRGWNSNPAWQGPIQYSKQLEVYGKSKVILGGTPNANYDYYTSDREFIALVSGVPFVDYWVPGVDRIFENGQDWWLGRSVSEMIQQCDRLLAMPSTVRETLAATTRERVLSSHTQYHRCLQMVRIVKTLLEARRSGRPAPEPVLDFLLPAAPGTPSPKAILNWLG